MKYVTGIIFASLLGLITACSTGSDVVRVKTVAHSTESMEGIGEEERARIARIQEEKKKEEQSSLKKVINKTENYTVREYLAKNPMANNPKNQDFSVGGYDVLDIVVYEDPELSRENVRVSADGFVTFPLINRVKVEGLTTSEIESLISEKLAQGEFFLNAHVSVTVKEFKSKKYIVLGSVKTPGTSPLRARERVLDAISKAGGVEDGCKTAMIIRTENQSTQKEKRIVIRIDLGGLLKGMDQLSNLLLTHNDLLYIPKPESFYIIGQVKSPGSFPYLEKEITLVEAISKAGGFTPIAARNRTRIIRVENGREQIIEIKVDQITGAGKKGQDVLVKPGDVIVVPESFF